MITRTWLRQLIAKALVGPAQGLLAEELQAELVSMKKRVYAEGYAKGHAEGRIEASREYMRWAHRCVAGDRPN